MVIPCAPSHRPVSHCDMALPIMGDPAMLNLAFLIGQPDGALAKRSGTTRRSFHEQAPVPERLEGNVDTGDEAPPLPLTSALWSLQCPRWPPCPGTMTSEHGCLLSQPRKWFSSRVSTSMLTWPVPSAPVTP